MLNEFFKQFKSGTDIRGVATEGVAGQNVNLTDDVIQKMADGFVLRKKKKVQKAPEALKISVGRDSRISGPHIMELTTARFKAAGAAVLRCGLASTPAMFMTTVDLGCDGALQITASHHPYNRNGLKFFTRDGGLEGVAGFGRRIAGMALSGGAAEGWRACAYGGSAEDRLEAQGSD